jgi:hypothetical protein
MKSGMSLSHFCPLPENYKEVIRLQFFLAFTKGGDINIILDHVYIEPDWSQVMIDTTVVRVHQHGSGAKGGKLNKQSIKCILKTQYYDDEEGVR